MILRWSYMLHAKFYTDFEKFLFCLTYTIPLIFLYMDTRKFTFVRKVLQRGKRHLIMLVFQELCTDLKSVETTS